MEESCPATTAWHLRCLLRAASTSSDLHFRTLAGPSDDGHAALMPARFDPAGEHWRTLPERWPAVASRAVDLLDRRLESLARSHPG